MNSLLEYLSTETVIAIFAGARYNFSTERQLQDGLEQRLVERKLLFQREAVLTSTERIDFLIGDLGVEVKTKGSPAALTRQLYRYAQCPEIGRLLVVTSLLTLTGLPETLAGKPLSVFNLIGSFL